MITINLDKERHLRLTLKGMLTYEKLTGKNLFKDFDTKQFTMEQTSALIYACLIHEDDLSYEEFLKLVDLSNIAMLSEAVSQCILESLPESEESRPLAGKSPNG
jgi:hypothetical protein